MKSARRGYTMDRRARTTEATGRRILDATGTLFAERPYSQLTLQAIADRAGVSMQTIIRRFSDKEGLTAAAAAHTAALISAQRGAVGPGDLAAAVENLLTHYEQFGRTALRLLAEEDGSPTLAELTREGREFHRAWCARVFEPSLSQLTGAARNRRLAQVVAICDVYTWKLLRIDSGLSHGQVRTALLEMLEPLLQ